MGNFLISASFDSFIHLQDSQTAVWSFWLIAEFDSFIHLQDSQTISILFCYCQWFDSFIHLQDSQTLICYDITTISLIHLFTYKTLKPTWIFC